MEAYHLVTSLSPLLHHLPSIFSSLPTQALADTHTTRAEAAATTLMHKVWG